MDQQVSRQPPIARARHDGWTQSRQIAFIVALHRTRNVSRAAAAAGMSRENAYRLRARSSAAEFAAAWDHALRLTDPMGHSEGNEGHDLPPPPVGTFAGEDHEGHRPGEIAPHGQPGQPVGIPLDRRAELLARIRRAEGG